ncbi:MAG: Fic family protein [Caulobacterales bacterium]|nr:Fic family protein [Caulobacterales bacterium]
MKSYTRLHLPPLSQVSQTNSIRKIEDRIAQISLRNTSFFSTFGLELKASHLVAIDGQEGRRQILNRHISRPAFEPILFHFCDKLCAHEIDIATMEGVASGAAARPIVRAVGEMRTSSSADGHYTLYAPLKERLRLTDCLNQLASETCYSPLTAALICYSMTIIAHPLVDGNGRLARALLFGTLRRARLIDAPIVPLGPAFYLHAGAVGPTMATLSQSGNWQVAVEGLASVISTACDLADAVDRLI